MAVTIRTRRDSANDWNVANPVLALGEIGLETDTLKAKFGDGFTAWDALPYFIDEGGTLPPGGGDGYTIRWEESTSAYESTDALVVADSGNVGIGTATPSWKFHTYQATGEVIGLFETGDASVAGIRLKNSIQEYRLANSGAGDLVVRDVTDGNNPFTIKGDAGANLMTLTAGNVGIGTTTPSQLLQLAGGNPMLVIQDNDSTGATASQGRLRFTDSTDTVLGQVGYLQGTDGSLIVRSNEVGQSIQFQCDGSVLVASVSPTAFNVHEGTGVNATLLWRTDLTERARISATAGGTFTMQAGAQMTFNTSGGSEAMRLDTGGNLLIGTTLGTSNRLRVRSPGQTNATNCALFENVNAEVLFSARDDGYIRSRTTYDNTNASAANLYMDANGYFYRSTSSLKYKTDVQDAKHGLAEVLALRPVTYRGNQEDATDQVFGGLIAEEVHDAGLTEFVQYAENGEPDALAYGNMVSLLVKAIQEQQSLITELTARVEAIEA